MEKLMKTQLLTLSLIVTLLSLTPLLSSSFRSTYLYFIINVLIIILGAQAGFLSSTSSTSSSSSSSSSIDNFVVDTKSTSNDTTTTTNTIVTTKSSCFSLKTVVETLIPEKHIIVCADEVKKLIKKCPSTPSLFFIESGNESESESESESEGVEQEEEVYQEEKEELFVKAEAFIGNFYKHLKMQREKSWNRIHGFNQNCLIS